MATYYKDSYVTICAASASKSSSGFLETRHRCKNHPESILPWYLLRLPYVGPAGEYGEVLFRESSPYSVSEDAIEERAWTFQERILSTRVLHYATYTI